MIGWLVLLWVVGLWIGTQVNRLIYDWAFFVEVSPSPWASKKKITNAALDASWVDTFPIWAWWRRRGLVGQSLYPSALAAASAEEIQYIPVLKPWFWWRAIAIELLCGFGLAGMYLWYFGGHWLGHEQGSVLLPGGLTTLAVMFVFHALIMFLMFVGAMIDWDEKTIPDQVTVSGLVLAVIFLVAWPDVRLPLQKYSGIQLVELDPLHFFSPRGIQAWSASVLGWVACVVAWSFWAILVLPSVWTGRFGLVKGIRLAIASVIRPARKNPASCKASAGRKIHPVTWVTLSVWSAAMVVLIVTWNLQGPRWEAFFTLSCSMALAGLGTWLVRILAGWAIGMETLGFGDVTLMFMFGAAFGWQFALLVFVAAPFLSMGYALLNYLRSGESALAFGPWLCLAAGLGVIFWTPIWHQHAANLFAMGPALIVIVGVCLLLLPLLLLGILAIKKMLGLV